jgi:alkylation response protein AidB-like acyl-CoA dehydrogenase
VDFWTTDDQEALRQAMRAFVAGRCPLDGLHGREESGMAIDRQQWRELAEMGVFSLRSDGLGAREAVIVFEELGRALVPGPLVATHLAAGMVDGAGAGATIVGLLDAQPYVTMIEHARQVDGLLRFAGDELRLVDPRLLTLAAVERPLDPLTPVWRCTADPPPGELIAHGEAVQQLHDLGVALTAALQLGVALSAVDLATDYAKHREQFGRPIGSFQAVKHMLAEMLVKAEVARAAVYAAACALDGASSDDPRRAASAAKVVAGEAALFNGRTGIQVHGGMGFTWEVDAQRYWKRAVVLDTTFGTTDAHAMSIAATL